MMTIQPFRLCLLLSVVAVMGATGCGSAVPAADASGESGLARDAVCQRYMAVIAEFGSITRAENSAGVTSDSEAQQHLRAARAMRTFGRWARGADEAALADDATRIEREAGWVVRRLSPTDSHRRASRLTDPLYEQTTELYYDCNAEIYRTALGRNRPEHGACAEPGAPTLDGPNVVVYGSSRNYIDSTCELVEGTKLADGCSFAMSAGQPTSRVGIFGSEEVATDHDTCRSLFETGRLAEDPSAPDGG